MVTEEPVQSVFSEDMGALLLVLGKGPWTRFQKTWLPTDELGGLGQVLSF